VSEEERQQLRRKTDKTLIAVLAAWFLLSFANVFCLYRFNVLVNQVSAELEQARSDEEQKTRILAEMQNAAVLDAYRKRFIPPGLGQFESEGNQ